MSTTAVTTQENNVATKPKTLKDMLNNSQWEKKFQSMLGERTQGFFVSISNVTNNNALLQKADPHSIMMAAAVAASLDLPIDPNLGFAYIVPYNVSMKDENGNWIKKVVAQFQLGQKGYKQLALRSGQFVKLNATDVRVGEIKFHDRLTGEIEFEWIENEVAREKAEVIGYVSFFKLINGFSQTFYMSKTKLLAHGKKYSQTFKNDKGQWKDDEESMMLKTVTKLNLSKNAPLSIQLQRANIADQSVIKNFDNDTIDVEYVDNIPDSLNIDNVEAEKQTERIAEHIKNAKTLVELEEVAGVAQDHGLTDLYVSKKDQLKK